MRLAPTCLLCLVAPLPAMADATATARLSVELNRIDTVQIATVQSDMMQDACRLTFLAQNMLGADIAALALETVLIDVDGRVDRLTLFDFGALPEGIPRVRQFDIPGLACERLGRVLINGVAECSGAQAFGGALDLGSRTDVEVVG